MSTYCIGSESFVLFLAEVTADLLNLINSLMTATEPLLAAICAQVMPLYEVYF